MVIGHPDQRWGGRSYAQHGDDYMILNLFNLMGIERPSYLDVGAHHPSIISNTKLLYDRGCRGINVDANPELMMAFTDERPDDVNLLYGVGPEVGSKTFYMFNLKNGQHGAGRNTFCEKERDHIIREGWQVARMMEIYVTTLNHIVDSWSLSAWPDLLCVDVEGWDYEILKSAQFKLNSPKVICVETRRNESLHMGQMLKKKGFFPYCRMGENMFFVASEFMDLVY